MGDHMRSMTSASAQGKQGNSNSSEHQLGHLVSEINCDIYPAFWDSHPKRFLLHLGDVK